MLCDVEVRGLWPAHAMARAERCVDQAEALTAGDPERPTPPQRALGGFGSWYRCLLRVA